MIIGTLTVDFRLHGIVSRKQKRSFAASLKQKLRNKFNVSVAEIDGLESLQRMTLAVVTVSNETKRVQSLINKAQSMIEACSTEEITSIEVELFGA
jgi:hypothetical protein